MWYLVDSKNREALVNDRRTIIKSRKLDDILVIAKVLGKRCDLASCDKGGCFQPAYMK